MAELLAYKFEIFDPLDRKIPNDEDNDDQAIKRDNLVKVIQGLESVNGSQVEAPFTDKSWRFFKDLVQKEFSNCEKIVDKVIK